MVSVYWKPTLNLLLFTDNWY